MMRAGMAFITPFGMVPLALVAAEALVSAVDRRAYFSCFPKKSSQKKGNPRHRPLRGFPALLSEPGRLRNSAYGLRQSSPTTPRPASAARWWRKGEN